MAILGLDPGEKRIGVAFAEGTVAVPLTVIHSEGEEADMERILSLAREYAAERIVVGLPHSIDGSVGPQAEAVLEFCTALSRRTDIPIDTWDERLSSVVADDMLAQAGVKPEQRQARRDAAAAAVILQSYLDGMK